MTTLGPTLTTHTTTTHVASTTVANVTNTLLHETFSSCFASHSGISSADFALTCSRFVLSIK